MSASADDGTRERDLAVKGAVYAHFAAEAERPSLDDVAESAGRTRAEVADAYRSLAEQRVLVLERDGDSIRMAPPFSGVATQHVAEARGRRYFANCAWDVLGVLAALQEPGVVRSRCEQSHELLELAVGADGPEASDWLFHCLVPASSWWDDIVFT